MSYGSENSSGTSQKSDCDFQGSGRFILKCLFTLWNLTKALTEIDTDVGRVRIRFSIGQNLDVFIVILNFVCTLFLTKLSK